MKRHGPSSVAPPSRSTSMPFLPNTHRPCLIHLPGAAVFRSKRSDWVCAYASDLNPVPVLINKALIEIPPRFANLPPINPESRGEAGPAGKQGTGRGRSVLGQSEWRGAQGLAEDVRYYGKWVREEAEKRIGNLYPKVKITADMAKDRPDLKPHIGDTFTVLAWIWARTVASPNPTAGGALVPLVRSMWLSTKKGQEAYVRPVVDVGSSSYQFRVCTGEPADDFDPRRGTVIRTGGRCILTNEPMGFEYLRSEGRAGRISARLMAVVAQGTKGRVYLSPTVEQEAAALEGKPRDVPDTGAAGAGIIDSRDAVRDGSALQTAYASTTLFAYNPE